jgi:amino acid adenylation domain-containing protein
MSEHLTDGSGTVLRPREGSEQGGDRRLPEFVVPGPHLSVADRVAEVAQFIPYRLALEAADGRLTYAQLHRRMTALAAELVDVLPAGEPGRQPVGILAEQGTDSVAAMLAVMATGHPCVVLDVQLPEGRLAQIAERAGVAVVLVDEARREIGAALPGVREVRGLLPADEHGAPVAAPPLSLDVPASLIFTSGTTGVPKGVTFTHRTALAVGYTSRAAVRFTPEDRIAMVLPYSFAAGQMLVFAAALNGATLCIRDPRVHGMADLTDWLRASQVTTLHCTPSLLRSLRAGLAEGERLESIRLVTTAGEKVYGRDVHAFRPHLGEHASFVNWMGSSETEALTAFEIKATDPVPEGIVPAGRPVPLRELTVLDDDGVEVPPGEVGILHVTSAHMSAGYWNDPAETAKRFEPLPDGRVRFRTGDRARIDADGIVHVLGRSDDAVKIRGYLVEPAEVEAALRRLPDVLDAAVRGVAGAEDTVRLVAWVVPDPHQRTASPASVRAGLRSALPDYMVPRDVVLMEALPHNERGKLDARALPEPPPRPQPVPPATGWESVVEQLWAPVLGLEQVGRDESFTALGGDSLAVEEMLAALRDSFGVSLTTGELAENPTLAEFSALVADARRKGSRSRGGMLVRLRPTGSRAPVFCFAGAGGTAALFEVFAASLGPDQPVYAFQVNGFENPGMPDWTVARTARRYVRMIEEIVPEGPVLLVGHSLGGLFALQAAHLLRARGREVPLVTILDTFLPPAVRGPGAQDRVAPASPSAVQRGRRDLWRMRVKLLGAGLWRYSPDVHQEVFEQHGARLARFHRPTPWSGRSLLILSEENVDDPQWWDSVLTGEREVHQFSCDHVALLRRPYVEQVAKRVTAAADACQTSAGDRRNG